MSIPLRTSHGTLLTAHEFERLPEEPGWQAELVRGLVVRESAPRPLHGRLQSRMAYHLESWMEGQVAPGAVLVHTGFLLARGPDTVRLPDVAYVSEGRIPENGYGGGLWELGPDLAVEVTSPTNSWTDVQERVNDYLAAGTALVWVIDPPTRTVTVYRSGVRAERLDESGELAGEETLPGFKLNLARFFEV